MGGISQLSASPTIIPNWIACSLTTGSVPGKPNDNASTAVFGGASTLSTTGQALNILLSVNNSAWISKPMTGFQSLRVMGISPMGRELVYNVGEIVPRKCREKFPSNPNTM